jgi:hypothetical protein
MIIQKCSTEDEQYWDNYSENFNMLAGQLLEHNIDIHLLRNTINAYDKYKNKLMKDKIKVLLKDI